jgi:ParB-like chromosome segregation protein Spo0J
VIIDGHRRWTAIQRAEAKSGLRVQKINLLVFGVEPIPEKRMQRQFICNGGKALTPIERADGILSFKNLGYTTKKISESLAEDGGGMGQSTISEYLKVAQAPFFIKDQIERGVISFTFALKLLNAEDNPEQQVALVRNAIANNKSESGRVTMGSIQPDLRSIIDTRAHSTAENDPPAEADAPAATLAKPATSNGSVARRTPTPPPPKEVDPAVIARYFDDSNATEDHATPRLLGLWYSIGREKFSTPEQIERIKLLYFLTRFSRDEISVVEMEEFLLNGVDPASWSSALLKNPQTSESHLVH